MVLGIPGGLRIDAAIARSTLSSIARAEPYNNAVCRRCMFSCSCRPAYALPLSSTGSCAITAGFDSTLALLGNVGGSKLMVVFLPALSYSMNFSLSYHISCYF